jgi:hypothetical protein
MRGLSYSEQLQRVVEQYRAAGEPWPATARRIAAWAIRQRLWQPQPDKVIRQCAEDLSWAMREEYITDPQGRSVRAKHAARLAQDGEQLTLWADIRTADRVFMGIAFQQRRQQIIGDCWQLKLDGESYNENANPGRPIQMCFDFTDDLRELEAIQQVSV